MAARAVGSCPSVFVSTIGDREVLLAVSCGVQSYGPIVRANRTKELSTRPDGYALRMQAPCQGDLARLATIVVMTSVIPAIDEGESDLADHLDELREMNSVIGDLMGEPGDLRTPDGLEVARKFLEELMAGQVPTDAAELREISGVPVRIFNPGHPEAVYLHIHGGGFAIGVAAMSDVPNATLSTECNLAVVSVDYRLAPSTLTLPDPTIAKRSRAGSSRMPPPNSGLRSCSSEESQQERVSPRRRSSGSVTT